MKKLNTACALALAIALAGCAAKSPSQYTLKCEMGGSFENCGQSFDTEYECRAAQQEMLRAPGSSAKQRGQCYRH